MFMGILNMIGAFLVRMPSHSLIASGENPGRIILKVHLTEFVKKSKKIFI